MSSPRYDVDILTSDGRVLQRGDNFTHGFQKYKFEYAYGHIDYIRVHLLPISPGLRSGGEAEGQAEHFGLHTRMSAGEARQ